MQPEHETPQFVHDCERCQFLGRYQPTDQNWGSDVDLYYCEQIGFPTVIARWSDQGHAYISGMSFAGFVEPITEAKRRAHERGLPLTAEGLELANKNQW